MQIIICDDDAIFLNHIKTQIGEMLTDIKVTYEIKAFSNSDEAIQVTEKYDLAFLDMETPHHSGLEVAHKLKELNPHIIIFVITSYNKYLDEAMDLNVFRFITKPVDLQRLKSGLEKAISLVDNKKISFTLRKDKTSHIVFSKDIIFVEISGHGTRVVTVDNEFYSNNKIEFWSEKLKSPHFYRVHKSYIANLEYITSFKRDSIFLLKKYSIPVAGRNRTDFREYLLNYIGET